MRTLLFLVGWLVAGAGLASAADQTIKLTIEAGKHDRTNVPVQARVAVPRDLANAAKVSVVIDGKTVPGQLAEYSAGFLGAAKPVGKDEADCLLIFVLPSLKANTTAKATATITPWKGDDKGFRWVETEGDHIDLLFGKRPVMSYMKQPLDESTKEKREATFKVFHHLYTPDGSRIITKGVGGQYTHHRGLFYGFMKTTYNKNVQVDTWHCTGDTHLAHDRVLVAEGGPVFGRQLVTVFWNGKGKETFATEEREFVVYNVPGGQMVDFYSVLTPKDGEVILDGDPQHAGFHFRADNEVSDKTKGQTIFIRPDGNGKEGTEKNWPGNKEMVNLPWNGMSFVVGDQRYTAAYLDHPDNPKEARYSERTYGRFGSYFVSKATKEKPLRVQYRVWLQTGQMKGDEIARMSQDFVEPVKVTVEKK